MKRKEFFNQFPTNPHGFPVFAKKPPKNANELSDYLKKLIKKEQSYLCNSCGKRKKLTIHHIKPRRDGGSNTRENLEGLCIECHELKHPENHKTS